jgi:uncharacterized membrane protein
MLIPFWLVNYLTTSAYARVSQSIREAEMKTHAEIVPVIVRTSGTQSLFLGPFLAIMFLLILAYRPTIITVVSISVAIVAILFFRKQQITRMVQTRAKIEFFELDLNQTEDSEGVLILVSFAEKRAALYLDEKLYKRVDPTRWDPVLRELKLGLRNFELGIGLVRAIDILGDILQEVAPKQHLDIDEVSNDLIIKE